MSQVSAEIESKVQSQFGEQDAPRALNALSSMKEPPIDQEWAQTRARVQIVVLMLAGCNLDRLVHEVMQSQVDWRDTLMAAGLGNENWQIIAKEAGYNVP